MPPLDNRLLFRIIDNQCEDAVTQTIRAIARIRDRVVQEIWLNIIRHSEIRT